VSSTSRGGIAFRTGLTSALVTMSTFALIAALAASAVFTAAARGEYAAALAAVQADKHAIKEDVSSLGKLTLINRVNNSNSSLAVAYI